MIYLYYTGSEQFDTPQQEINKSLGGNISSTIIPNSQINSLFRDVSSYSKQKGTSETICIALKNISQNDLLNFTLFCELSSEDFTIEAAIALPSINECNIPVFEKLKTSEQSPYYAEFNNIVNEDNAISIAEFKKDSYLGLFLRKKIKSQGQSGNQCKAIDYQDISRQEEQFSLNFSWD